LPTLKILSAGAVQAMVVALGAEFERASGHTLDLNFGTAGSLRDRLKGGEGADLVILPAAMVAALEKEGVLVAGSRLDLASTVTGVAVREGAPAPDISTPEAFKQALIRAKSVSYTDPAAGGSSGTFFSGLLQKLGIADEVNRKAILGKRGFEVAQFVADGKAEIGTTFISEILTVQGAKVVGPLPGELHNSNTYSAGIPARSAQAAEAKALIAVLTAKASRPRWVNAGLEPAFA